MKSKAMLFQPLLAALLILSACGVPQKLQRKKPNRVVMFVHGDPNELIVGTKRDATSFLTAENFTSFNGFHFAGAGLFIEQERQYNPKDFSEVEKANSTGADADDDDELDRGQYSFSQDGDRVVYRPENSASQLPSLAFRINNGVLELSDMDGHPLTAQHYSLKKDGKAFSVLASFSNAVQGRGLLAITFADSSNVNALAITAEDQRYNYLFGHYRVTWRDAISLDLCGQVTQQQKDSIQLSMDAWYADPLRLADEPYRPVKLGFRTEYPPFSDLNSRCIYLVNNYKDERSTNFYTAGLTLPAINYASKELIDGDIFLFMDHISDELGGLASPTAIHEIGHFLGLGHEFDDPLQGHDHYKSIMSYSDGAHTVTAGDFEAIRNLYKQSLGDAAKLGARVHRAP